MSSGISNLRLGSDDETAMRKALQLYFPRASTVVCTRHLKEDFLCHAHETAANADRNVKEFVHRVFGDAGLTFCDDNIRFDDSLQQLRSTALSKISAAL